MIYVGQSYLRFNVNTGLDNLAEATLTKIVYRKPSGAVGFWPSSVDNTSLVYELADGDLDEAGNWQIQAHVEFNDRTALGIIAKVIVREALEE
jgi:hypothetical protein